MQVIDLSQMLEPAMPVYPGTEPPLFAEAATIDTDGYREKRLSLRSHTGTHMDAPAHIMADGWTLDQLPVETFIGEALVFNCTGRERTTIEERELRPHAAQISRYAFFLLHTGWSRFWGDQRYYHDYPVVSEGAARWLVAAGLRGVGVDAISVDAPEAADLPVHRILLGAGLVIVENLTNLAAVPKRSFLFSCFPLKIKAADGSPARAAALLP